MILQKIHYNSQTFGELLRIALPMMISQGTFAIMIFTDRYFMSQIDPTHMAAALGGGVAFFFSFCFFSGLFSYINALSAQYLGAGEPFKCPKVLSQGLLMTLGCLPILAAITYFVSDMFAMMDHDPTQERLERRYFEILMLGAPVSLVKVCVSSYFAGINRPRVVMICDLIGLLVNVPLCYVMVFGFKGFPALGIEGAALSTIIATFISVALFFIFYFESEHRRYFSVGDAWHYDRGIFRRFLRLGFPAGFELFLNVAAFNLFLLMFQGYGIVEGASAAIVFNWDLLSFVPMLGLNIAVVSMIGRFVGARDMQQTNQVISAAFLIAFSYSGVIAVLYISFRFSLVSVFEPPSGDFSEILSLASFMMVGLASYAMVDATIQVAGGVLRGAGDTKWLLIASTTTHWVALIAQYMIIRVFDWGPRASWLAFVAMLLTISLLFVWRLARGSWREEEALSAVMRE